MNSKQLFFFSLILLSVAMGMHWFKNKPKSKPVARNRPRVALNLSDLQLQDEGAQTTTGEGGEGEGPVETGEGGEGTETPEGGETGEGGESTGTDVIVDTGEGGETGSEVASGSEEIASGTSDIADPLLTDPVIVALKNMPRNPFERSPYAALVEQLRMASDIPEETAEKKAVSLLNANFSATIRTSKELVAVIDSRLYRKGDLFQDKTITEIKEEIVSLEANSAIFLVPKTGVKVTIAEDGTYTVVDNFHKN